MKLLIDGDIAVYRIGYSCQRQEEGDVIAEPERVVISRLNEYIDNICKELKSTDYQIYLTSTDKSNFRYLVYPEYKANRTQPKPVHYDFIREYLINRRGAEVVYGMEADDALGIAQTEDTCIVSIDKDLLQVPGFHYNPAKQELRRQDELGGWLSFYSQLLTGDSTDNVPGLRGIGPVRSFEALGVCEGWRDMVSICRRMYANHGRSDEELIRNATLLFVLRYPNQDWRTEYYDPAVSKSEGPELAEMGA